MARARNIKPGFFKNEQLVEVAYEYRLLYIGLWTLADREGKLEDRPKRIKMEVFPADSVDVEAGLIALTEQHLIERYEVNGQRIIRIPTFLQHQNPHRNESDSVLPNPVALATMDESTSDHGTKGGGPKAVPLRLNPDSLNPDSLNPVSNETDAAASAKALEEQIWDYGLKTVARLAGATPKTCRTMLGKWRKDADDRQVLDAIISAEKNAVSDPMAWITKSLQPADRRARQERFRGYR